MTFRTVVLALLASVVASGPVQAQSGPPETPLAAQIAQAAPAPPAPAAPPATPVTPQAPRTPQTPRSPTAPKPPTVNAPDAPPPPPAPPPAPRLGQTINVKVEVTITDQQANAAPSKKTLSVVVADALNGSVRTTAMFPGVGPVPLNMDAQPTILADGKMRLYLTLQYDLPSPSILGRKSGSEERQPTSTSISERLMLIVENGKSLVAAQSADPVSDRQVTLEVKATILR